MAIYIVGYDLHPIKGETYDELTKAIKAVSNGDWWHCLDSTWLIKTTKTATQVRDALLQHIKTDDQLLVIQYDQINRGAAWFGFSGECQSWLKNNL